MLIGVIKSAQVPDCGSFAVLGILGEGMSRGICGGLILNGGYFWWGLCRYVD